MMSDAVLTEAIRLGGQVVTAFSALIGAWFAFKASQHSRMALDSSQEAVQVARHTEQNTNHMKDELVALTAKASHAEGVKEGEANAGR